ncbi:glycosyltransferase [Fervidobacterium thailandense]|uniref:Glycosyltransferase 2-like domain-containing protein n=1 Tax=Fervidobacterium thailandense TaxID=1008305 RepID=A0A1E3G5P1_9BACT|nr:glycosyltransferase [Fervidobacterium thailandense]ODN30978.1 hypothetical protein A4H02_01495 [Fervidobacterium thailandense]
MNKFESFQKIAQIENRGPLVSVIIPTFNVEQQVTETLKSVMKAKQFFHNNGVYLECVVIDGNSSDNTRRIIEYFAGLNVVDKFISEPDNGIYDALNKGLKISNGEYVLVLGAGDVLITEKIELILRNLIEYKPDILYGNQVMVKRKRGRLIVKRLFISGKFLKARLKFGWHPPHGSTFIKKHG